MFSNFTILSSIVYFYMIYSDNAIGKYILKPLTTLLIIGVSLENENTRNNTKLYGLLLSLLGDILLMFAGENMFILGLASFLCAHVFYISLFYKSRTENKNLAILFSLLAIGAVYYSFLYKEIYVQGGFPMLVAVLSYIVVITFMVYYALLNYNTQLSIGVVLFFISDATIALNKFIIKSTGNTHEYVIMSTYYLAQYCIAKFKNTNYTPIN